MSTNKKLYIENLILEVTRKCNMSCAHCMRGNAEELDLSFSTIQPLLDRLDGIGTITFTGGEPTLHIPVMKEILNYCREKEISIYNFYIVTNGKQISDEFLLFLLHLYQYCYEHNDEVNEFSRLALSKDDFHEPIPSKNQALLSTFTFYHPQKKLTILQKYQSYLRDEPFHYRMMFIMSSTISRIPTYLISQNSMIISPSMTETVISQQKAILPLTAIPHIN